MSDPLCIVWFFLKAVFFFCGVCVTFCFSPRSAVMDECVKAQRIYIGSVDPQLYPSNRCGVMWMVKWKFDLLEVIVKRVGDFKVRWFYPLGTVNDSTKCHDNWSESVLRNSAKIQKCQSVGRVGLKVRGSSKSVGFILWKCHLWQTIQLRVQSGPNWCPE